MSYLFRSFTTKMMGIIAVMVVLFAAFSITASAEEVIGTGTVTGSIVNIRAEANTTSAVVAQAAYGDVYNVLLDQYGWVKVEFNGNKGWICGDYITVNLNGVTSRGTITGSAVNVRTGPGTGYGILGLVYYGQTVPIKGQENGWVNIDFNGNNGWVSGDYVSTDRDNGSSRSAERASSAGQAVVNEAMKYLGKPYVYGGNGPNAFDCSGFTSYVYRQLGYSLNRTAAGQNSNGVAVSKENLQPGDLVTFYDRGYSYVGHVGIYIGNGQMIHAGNSSTGVIISDINSSYYGSRFVSGRSIVR